MKDLMKKGSSFPAMPATKPDKTETFAGKQTARVTWIYQQEDGSVLKATEKINKDGSISKKVERRSK